MTREEHDKPRADAEERAALSACGALTPPERTALESDLARDGELRREVARLDRVARALVATVDPVTPDPRVRDAVLRSAPGSEAKGAQVWSDWKDDEIDSGILFTLPGSEGSWEPTGIDGIEVRRLFVDRVHNRMTAMFRMAAGTAYAPHVHDGPEECYVLEGDLHVGEDIVMHAGDYQRAPAGSTHGVQRTEHGCVLLISGSLHDELI